MILNGDSIVFTCKNQKYNIPVEDILYVLSEGNYSRVFTKINEKSFLICKTLKYVELSLRKKDFFRVSRGVLINQNHIINIDLESTTWLIMTNAKRFPISFRRRKDFLELYQEKLTVLS